MNYSNYIFYTANDIFSVTGFFKILITFERIIQVKYCFHVININQEEPR